MRSVLWMKANMREGRPAMDLLNNLFVHPSLFAYQTCSKIRSKCPERPVNQVRLRSANLDPRQCRSSLATKGLCCRCVRPLPRKVQMRKARYQVRVQRVQHVHPVSKQAAATTFRHCALSIVDESKYERREARNGFTQQLIRASFFICVPNM